MDWDYTGKLVLSVIVFAPGLIVLGFTLVVGLLMLLEKTGLFEAISGQPAASGRKARARRIVAQVKHTVGPKPAAPVPAPEAQETPHTPPAS